ncbi:MAG: pyridoxamine 5'-phosphate oxidase [Bizionia paragorgiae]|uniref:pyridoxamine 5'-phosphate oxidase n=1 Tax=Bizionia paragorgiae TaxID=283786 RepID=UPI003C554CE9
MKKDLGHYRKAYTKSELIIENTPDDPIGLFKEWFNDVDASFPDQEANAMTLSTIGLDGYPKNRIVLLKMFTSEGFVFYTNYDSDKGQAIANNPKVSLSFFWEGAERQVIIKGVAEKVSESESDAYFNSRPRGSQLGAMASNQSHKIESREALQNKLESLEKEYEGKPLQRPNYWGGYLIKPVAIEFWQGRPNRLHDRVSYEYNENTGWIKNQLAP